MAHGPVLSRVKDTPSDRPVFFSSADDGETGGVPTAHWHDFGAVKDSSGAVIPGASITAKNVETGLTRTGVSAEAHIGCRRFR